MPPLCPRRVTPALCAHPRRLDANWTVGPNNLFYQFIEVAARRGYRYMLQLEPDVLPLRELWLERGR